MTIFIQPSSLSQWQALLSEAQVAASVTLQEDLESYLAFMLMRFCQQPEIAKSTLGLEFLIALDSLSGLQDQKLQEVGDKCLIYSGLFPENAHKRRVSMNYYIELGQTAYAMLSDKNHYAEKHKTFELYTAMCNQFVSMRDVLDAMRDSDLSRNNDLLAYFDLWQKFKSGYALKKLQGAHIITIPNNPTKKLQ